MLLNWQTHKVFFGENRGRGDAAHSNRSLSEADRGFQGKLDPHCVCNYCLGEGHWRNECPVLKKKLKPVYSPAKSSAAAASLRAERSHVIAAVREHTKPFLESGTKVPVKEQQWTISSVSEEIDPGYAAFVADGHVSLVGSDRKVPVKILRDSGALDSFIYCGLCASFLLWDRNRCQYCCPGDGVDVFFCSTA